MSRGREGMGKRQRELARERQKEAKRLRREALTSETDGPDGAQELRLMDEFRVLSERHAAGEVSDATLSAERHRIFVELGLEKDPD